MQTSFKFIVVFIIFTIMLISCAPAPTPTLLPTITPSVTPFPTSTLTPTPTSTPTITPTPSVEQIAEALGLPTEVKVNETFSYFNKYRIDGTNLINDYNNTIAAQRNAEGVWGITTDNTVKYGALADSLGMEVLEGMNFGGGDMAHIYDERYRTMALNLVFTGEWEAVDWVFPKTGQTIKDWRAAVVYPDGDGTVKKLSVSVFSPDMSEKFGFRWSRDGNWLDFIDWNEALKLYLPGQKWLLRLVQKGPDLELVNGKCYPSGICGEEFNRLIYLRYEQKEKIKVFAESWADDNPNTSEVPEGLVIPQDVLSVTDYKK